MTLIGIILGISSTLGIGQNPSYMFLNSWPSNRLEQTFTNSIYCWRLQWKAQFYLVICLANQNPFNIQTSRSQYADLALTIAMRLVHKALELTMATKTCLVSLLSKSMVRIYPSSRYRQLFLIANLSLVNRWWGIVIICKRLLPSIEPRRKPSLV